MASVLPIYLKVFIECVLQLISIFRVVIVSIEFKLTCIVDGELSIAVVGVQMMFFNQFVQIWKPVKRHRR